MCQDTRSGGLNDLLASAEIGHDALVDLSRKEAFEAPDDLAFGSAIGGASGDVVAGGLVESYTDDDGAIEGGLLPAVDPSPPRSRPEWLAYVSDESGRDEVYVRPYPIRPGEEYTISTSGGQGPVWSRDGRELFYQDGEQMMAVAVETGETFRPSEPEPLFAERYELPLPNSAAANYDVAEDGRFLMMKGASTDDGQASAQLVLVQNWFEELKRLVPAN